MIKLQVRGEYVEGRPVYQSNNRIQVLLRDGALLDFRPSEARNMRKSAAKFRGYSAGELRGRLAREFGKHFEVTGTGHYLVVHPRGQKDRWAKRFEDLYRDFVHYFSVRGFKMQRPDYPLVAVVWKTRKDFFRHAAESGTKIASNVLGYYSPITNRVHLYDSSGGSNKNMKWQQTASTIIHEVTHQTAFNTGIHVRFAGTPLWVAEGLGTLFEAPGIHSSRKYARQKDRINRGRLLAYKGRKDDFRPGFIKELIQDDRIFQRDSEAAYAQAWALTFYLVETQSHRYSKYLARTAERESGQTYSSSARLKDYVAVFGDEFKMHEARLARFMKKVN
jgi:hypothetical protein